MSDKECSFIQLCENVRFCDDVHRISKESDSHRELSEYAAQMRARGLRISEALTPKLYATVAATARNLMMSYLPEAYVVPEPQPNAFAPVFGPQCRPLVVLTSGIVELLNPLELQFVIGHELGHLGLGHPGIPKDTHYKNELEELKRLSISRASEISADRVGLIATSSLVTAANVKIKLASGLSSSHIRPDVNGFLEQLSGDWNGASREWELYQLHPSLPLRLWSLVQFSKTSIYIQLTQQGLSGIELNEADILISEKMAEIGDGKLSKLERRNFDLAVMWLGAALVFDDEVIEAHEKEMLKTLVGEDLASKALSFASQQGLEAVIEKLKDALERLDMSDARILNKITNTYDLFIRRINIVEDCPKAYRILKRYT